MNKFVAWLSVLIIGSIISFISVDCIGGKPVTEAGEVFDEKSIPAHYEQYTDHVTIKTGKTTVTVPIPKQRYVPAQYFLIINSRSMSGVQISVSWLKYCNTHVGDKIPMYFREGKYTGCQYRKQISTELLTEQ